MGSIVINIVHCRSVQLNQTVAEAINETDADQRRAS